MTGREILHKVKEKVGLGSSEQSAETGKGKSKMSKHVTHGYHTVKGKSAHPMEDFVFAEFRQVDGNELGLFAIFDGHVSQKVPDYLRSNLFDNILKEPDFWNETEKAIRRAYHLTDDTILKKSAVLGKGGSTAVTAILINCEKLVVANLGDSRAVLCRNGEAKQLSIDHEPDTERKDIEERGGFVTKFPGDVARVDGQLAVARAFGDKSIKEHLSSEPHVVVELIDDDAEFAILASDGIWHVMNNQEAVDCVKNVNDARAAAVALIDEALKRNSSDDISVIVVRFQ
ncbi:hypothetical protein RND81_09G017900 [Saponaria officinalis]|uniref:protein-serine/threonine phosphatase n=1 Tax=Saponaria officinalis TaxID=3572 RepID=A0AAW1IHD1_SAPOF